MPVLWNLYQTRSANYSIWTKKVTRIVLDIELHPRHTAIEDNIVRKKCLRFNMNLAKFVQSRRKRYSKSKWRGFGLTCFKESFTKFHNFGRTNKIRHQHFLAFGNLEITSSMGWHKICGSLDETIPNPLKFFYLFLSSLAI